MTTALAWWVHNVVAHPVMGTLELVGDVALALGCSVIATKLWQAAGLVHTWTVPASTP